MFMEVKACPSFIIERTVNLEEPEKIDEYLAAPVHGLKNIETTLPFSMPFGTSILACGQVRT
jgi:hypothetical protein